MTKTRKEVMEYILENFNTDEILEEFATHELEKIEKRNANRKPTKTQVQNEKDKVIILEILKKSNKALSSKEIIALEPNFAGYSTQKISALMTLLDADGAVKRFASKGRGELVTYTLKPTE